MFFKDVFDVVGSLHSHLCSKIIHFFNFTLQAGLHTMYIAWGEVSHFSLRMNIMSFMTVLMIW